MSGIFGGGSKSAPVAEVKLEPTPPAEKPMAQQTEEDRSARRRARRGGRAMLSDSRLNPEQGVSTLGSQGL